MTMGAFDGIVHEKIIAKYNFPIDLIFEHYLRIIELIVIVHMRRKDKDKKRAVKLRMNGLSYSEIRKHVKVSKSSLSLWLRSVGLTKRQKQRLTDKKWASIRRGWEKWKNTRIKKVTHINNEALMEARKIDIDKERLWLMGLMLYWAEGSKTKEYDPGRGVSFSNSDPRMIRLFLSWLRESLDINDDRIKLDIYIHENKKNDLENVKRFWSQVTGFSKQEFDRIYFKKHKILSLRKNVGDDYHGLLRVQVRSSADLNRRITGWIEGIYKKMGDRLMVGRSSLEAAI